jgi:hypothetical protein
LQRKAPLLRVMPRGARVGSGRAATAHSGRGSGEPRPPFAALNVVLSEPRAKRPKAAGASGKRAASVCVAAEGATAAGDASRRAGWVRSRGDRSLWPGFWRTPAPVRGSERGAFRAASEAAEGRGSERSRAASVCVAAEGATAAGDASRRAGWVRSRGDRSLWPGFWRTPAPVRGSERGAFRAASEAAEGRGSERPRAASVCVAAEGATAAGDASRRAGWVRSRGDRSLWPGFWRTPAAVRGSERGAFRAASEAAEGRGSERPRAASVCVAAEGATAAGDASRRAGWVRSRGDRSLWPGFWRTPAPVRGSERGAFRAASEAANDGVQAPYGDCAEAEPE